jgi:hypothetical protein
MNTLPLNQARQKLAFIVVAATALTFGASIALSDPGIYTPPKQVVRFADLDLSKPADVESHLQAFIRTSDLLPGIVTSQSVFANLQTHDMFSTTSNNGDLK